jgi:hypothetical protein
MALKIDKMMTSCAWTAAGDVDWIIYLGSSIGWPAPYRHEPITREKWQQIRERVIESLEFLKIKYYLPDQHDSRRGEK